jgi:tRNA-uridine 2-sulfurtransferase
VDDGQRLDDHPHRNPQNIGGIGMAIKVYVGMSGGVDSSLSAALLKMQGYDVTGVYMKNWTQDLPGMKCPWADDLADAKRVAVQLDIPFKVFDFQKEYKQKVVDYMIDEYKAGRTPNPDVMCNQEVKFKLFLETALADGADMIATGHYARVSDRQDRQGATSSFSGPRKVAISDLLAAASGPAEPSPEKVAPLAADENVSLLTAKDNSKDQTYFLYRVTEEALNKTIFPLGDMTKTEVREKAKALGLATAAKKDSQGICFVGKVGIKEFLQQYVTAEPGDIVDKKTGKVIGQHDGAIFYTFGQRHGLGVGGGLPYYVVGKDMAKNILYVTTDLDDDSLWRDRLRLDHLHWIQGAPDPTQTYKVRTRYRAPLVECALQPLAAGELMVRLAEPERAITPGQSAVLYDGDRVVGGGIVAEVLASDSK